MRRHLNSEKMGQNELRFMSYVVGLYATFIYWGVFQERLTNPKQEYVLMP